MSTLDKAVMVSLTVALILYVLLSVGAAVLPAGRLQTLCARLALDLRGVVNRAPPASLSDSKKDGAK